MKKRLLKMSLFYSSLFLIISCVTINIYFPAAAVEKVADRIVEETWGDKEVKPENDEKPESLIEQSFKFAISIIEPAEAFAQGADINVTTPTIRALKQAMKKRAGSIKPYLDRGNAGISNEGLLVNRSGKGLNLKEKAELTRLIRAENKDRKSLYAEIAKANKFGPDRIADIKKIFAASWIKNARKGWWVQGQNGKWHRK